MCVRAPPTPARRMATHLSKLIALTCPEKPKAVLVASAHWETRNGPTVTTSAAPPLLFDYYGFPPETYELTWPAPGYPALASRVKTLLDDDGFRTSQDGARGFDHGVFCPLKLTFPDADVPVVQLSLVEGLDPETHLAMGRALAPLRREGVLIVGSGMSFHNMGGFMSEDEAPKEASKEFDAWLAETCSRWADARWLCLRVECPCWGSPGLGMRMSESESTRRRAADFKPRAVSTKKRMNKCTTTDDTTYRVEPPQRTARLMNWTGAPSARICHPREEHLIPLMVAVGAAEGEQGRRVYSDAVMGCAVSGFEFGDGGEDSSGGRVLVEDPRAVAP